MNKGQVEIISDQLTGLKQYEWIRIKQQVDMIFNSKAAKVQLDDSAELKRALGIEFNFQRFGEKLD